MCLATGIINPNPDHRPLDPMMRLRSLRYAPKRGALGRAASLRLGIGRIARKTSTQPLDIISRKFADQWRKFGQWPAG
jgi:hypothetical protein